ncbi:glucose-6-phosphate isomerase [Minwuia thermotolerans]|uniref:Glucose-6-phosphate isomerase n=1 Tax=Minwuia thermotolerans TaxID=2056226 RepID=A0A2M9FXF0_9PROT|nr:glucose-6-phosphate isomerase [Minwuia thermotolerans]PJK28133.1 glucose-6-phosphate isomerase [Minwuia thermotolerans]
MAQPFDHYIDACLEATVSDGGLREDSFRSLIERGRPALREIRGELARGGLPHFGLASRRDDLRVIESLAMRLREDFRRVVILGTGGSSLGGQALVAIAPAAERRRLVFADNLDGGGFAELLADCEPARTHFVVISKSGSTTETLAQTFAVLDWARRQKRPLDLPRHFTVITEPGDNPLRRLADRLRLPLLDHDPEVGGRFSVLSLVGLLPGLIAGLDVMAVRKGAALVFERAIAEEDPAPLAAAALAVGLARERGRTQQVILPYAGALERFAQWHRQLWAESLGKNGRGVTPVAALGPVDQHSQLQLWLDGPADKSFTVITVAEPEPGPMIEPDLIQDPDLGYLSGQSLGAIVKIQARATIETLVDRGHPTRMIRLQRLDERTLGGLFMHFMLETVLAAHLLGISAYGQPAVESSKKLTKQYLAAG